LPGAPSRRTGNRDGRGSIPGHYIPPERQNKSPVMGLKYRFLNVGFGTGIVAYSFGFYFMDPISVAK
jgi:hypothetical protein